MVLPSPSKGDWTESGWVMATVGTDVVGVARVRAEAALAKAFKAEAARRAALATAVEETAAAIVIAREAGVPWAAVQKALGGVGRAAAVERVRRSEARAAGGRLASYEGTSIRAEDPGEGAGAWGWATTREGAEEGAELAGAAERRALLAEGTGPTGVLEGVRAVKRTALRVAELAIEKAEAQGPLSGPKARELAKVAAAGYLPPGRTVAGA